MLKSRIIPCLLIKNGNLVKTIKFKNEIYIGDPINSIKIFNEKEVDELILLDINASKVNQEPNYQLIEKCAGECFMPLVYGGGITSVEQARQIFSMGIEKISLQTALLGNIELLNELVSNFGSQAIIASVDIKRNWRGVPAVYTHHNNKINKMDWLEYLDTLSKSGVGEILINFVDRDGSMQGSDLYVINKASKRLDVPLIAMGGIGSITDIKNVIKAGAAAVAAGSFFLFYGPHRAVLITYPSHSQLEFLLEL